MACLRRSTGGTWQQTVATADLVQLFVAWLARTALSVIVSASSEWQINLAVHRQPNAPFRQTGYVLQDCIRSTSCLAHEWSQTYARPMLQKRSVQRILRIRSWDFIFIFSRSHEVYIESWLFMTAMTNSKCKLMGEMPAANTCISFYRSRCLWLWRHRFVSSLRKRFDIDCGTTEPT